MLDTLTRAHPRVKICCMASVEEAHTAIALGADAVGLVSAMPSGPGPIGEDLIRTITDSLPPMIASFLLTCLQDAEGIIAQQRRCRANTLQLVDSIPLEAYRVIRDALPGVAIVQVIHIRDESSIAEAHSVSRFVDAILLDSGNPTLAVKELGGTGRVHDWTISRRVREAIGVPVILAGGLNALNVRDAIDAVEPFAVDICSGVRTNGLLDPAKAAAFMKAVKS